LDVQKVVVTGVHNKMKIQENGRLIIKCCFYTSEIVIIKSFITEAVTKAACCDDTMEPDRDEPMSNYLDVNDLNILNFSVESGFANWQQGDHSLLQHQPPSKKKRSVRSWEEPADFPDDAFANLGISGFAPNGQGFSTQNMFNTSSSVHQTYTPSAAFLEVTQLHPPIDEPDAANFMEMFFR
jgi:hypothetical protein